MTSIIIITCLELVLVAIAVYVGYRICDKKAPRFDADRRCDKCGTFMKVVMSYGEVGHRCHNEKCDSYGK